MNKIAEDVYKKFRESSADDIKFITRRDNSSNKWEMRASAGVEPQVPVVNAQNLFDDSDHVDNRWLKLAKKHLSQWKLRR